MKFYVLFLLGIIMVMGFASATIFELEPIKIGECTQIVNQDTSGVTEGTVTFVRLPDGSFLNMQVDLQARGNGSFNYTFCNTTQSGTYIANGLMNGTTPWNYKFVVNSLGKDLSSSQSTLYTLLFIFGMLLAAVLIYIGAIIPFKNNRDENTGFIISINNLKYFKIIIWFFAYVVMTAVVYLAWMISYAYLDLVFVSNLLNVLFYAMAITILPGFIIMIVMIIMHAVKDSNLADELSMGRRVRE